VSDARGTAPDLSVVRAVEVPARAKINLRLRILAREESGYHQLETLFLLLDLADRVLVRRSDARSLDVAGAHAGSVGPVERNLAWRAAVAYAEATSWRGGFAIELDKHIPVGGGLGGGSADAAAVLRALDALSPAPIGDARLLQIAASLGSDVPFLVTTHPYALAWGRGERLLPLLPPPARDVVLAVPEFGVNTAEAYRWLASSRSGASFPQTAAEVLDLASLSDWSRLAPLAVNDFESVVAARHPEIARLIDSLGNAGCEITRISGSGSTVFGIVPAGCEASVPVLEPSIVTLLTRTATRVEPVSAVE
jgi:4-diphosphocytidyl-2-C-methyl-D-erythritol kinase